MSNEIRVKCRKTECGHVWVIAYLPMEISDVSKCAKRATCPKCADTKPLLAKQEPTNG